MELRILLLFFVSGFSGLIYEIIWIKLFSLSFGNTTYAISTVLAAFMLGLSLGGVLFGKMADKAGRDIQLFALMELGVGVSALLLAFFFPFLNDFYIGLHKKFSLSPEGSTLLRFLAAFLVLLIPTTLMGGTLPALSRCLIGELRVAGPEISRLYGVNTLGASLGCFLTGYLFIPSLGITESLYFAIALNITVAGIAFLSRGDFAAFAANEIKKEAKLTKTQKETRPDSGKTREWESVAPLLLLAGLAGFCGLAYEILWTRAFAVLYKSTTYLFSNILTVFLLGIAAGSLAYQKFLEGRGPPLLRFGQVQWGIGCYGLLSILLFSGMAPEGSDTGQWTGASSWGGHILRLFALNLLVAGIPAFLMGLAFPLVNKAAITSLQEVGEQAGWVYGMNVLGGIFGSLVAGFLLIPFLGVQTGILGIAVLNFLAGAIALFPNVSKKEWMPSSLGFSVAALTLFLWTLGRGHDIGAGSKLGGEILYSKEGAMGTVRVIQEKEGKGRTLSVNQYLLATTGDVAVRFGHLPLLLHPSPKEVLAISLGAGITTGAVGTHGEVERINCVEIVPDLVEAADFFRESNRGILSHPKFHLTLWDGRNFIQTTPNRYDVIIADLFQPDSSGAGNLYAKEHYENCLTILKPGGIMVQWLPLYQLHSEDLKVVIATFASVFPKTSLWFGDINGEKPTLMLLGGREKLSIDPSALHGKMNTAAMRKDLIEWDDPYSLLGFFITDEAGLKDFLGGAPINSDNHPHIEYSAPKHVWDRSSEAVKNFRELAGLRSPFRELDPAIPGEKRSLALEKIESYFKARTLLLEGRVAHALGDFEREMDSYRQAEAVGVSDPYLGFSYFELGHLYLGQGRLQESLHFLEKATALAPHLPEAHFFLSKTYQQAGEKEKAEREYRLAMESLQ